LLGEAEGNESKMEVKEYEGMGYAMGGVELRDLCTWFKRVIPPVILVPRAT
jgi:hypothetical protein